jgi:hypothetical protein
MAAVFDGKRVHVRAAGAGKKQPRVKAKARAKKAAPAGKSARRRP